MARSRTRAGATGRFAFALDVNCPVTLDPRPTSDRFTVPSTTNGPVAGGVLHHRAVRDPHRRPTEPRSASPWTGRHGHESGDPLRADPRFQVLLRRGLVIAWHHDDKGAQRVTGPELVVIAASW
jgi:hypothetical protein